MMRLSSSLSLCPLILFLGCSDAYRSKNMIHHWPATRGRIIRSGRLSYMSSSEFLTSTHVKIPKSQFNLNHESKTFFIGSCFSETIHSNLRNNKFSTLSNPYGIIFNPHSLALCLENVCARREFVADDVFVDGINSDVFHSWDHHSSYSSTDRDTMITRMNKDINTAHQHLRVSDALFITMGASRVHMLASTGNIVSNCHKQPGTMFTRQIMSPQEIVDRLKSALTEVRRLNPTIKVKCLAMYLLPLQQVSLK